MDRPSSQQTRWLSTPELLEARQLLAADLVVEPQAIGGVSPGEEVTYQVRVTNRGPDDAVRVTFRDPVSEILDDATWSRTADFVMDLNKVDGKDGFTIRRNGPDSSVVSSGAGDLNGDGWDDVVIGDPFGEAMAYVVFGAEETARDGELLLSDLNGTAGFSIQCRRGCDATGRSVAGIGDFNADGVDDLLIGSSTDSHPGVAHVLFGSLGLGRTGSVDLADLEASAGLRIAGSPGKHGHGKFVGSAGDFNGDGINDLMVAGTQEVLVVYGGQRWTERVSVSANELPLDDGFVVNWEASDIAAAGDLNDDGFDDIVLSTERGSERFWVLLGGSELGRDGNVTPTNLEDDRSVLIAGSRGSSLWRQGLRASGAGDMNADGIDDLALALGRPGVAGETYVIFGHCEWGRQRVRLSALDGSNGYVLEGVKAELPFRDVWNHSNVAGVGDMNGDGFDDLMIGAATTGRPGLDNPPPGQVFVVYGGPEVGSSGRMSLGQLTDDAGFVLTTNQPYDLVGRDISHVGDVNQDGLADLSLSAPLVRKPESETYVVYGHSSHVGRGNGSGDIHEECDLRVGTTVTYTVTGLVPEDSSGRIASRANVVASPDRSSVPLVGDIDRDAAVGFSDFLILAHNFERGRTDATEADGDLDADGIVGKSDLAILRAEFGRTIA